MWVFISPTSWAFSMISCGQVPSLSYSQATGRISFSAKSWASSRRFFCSSVSVKSTTSLSPWNKRSARRIAAARRRRLTGQSTYPESTGANPSGPVRAADGPEVVRPYERLEEHVGGEPQAERDREQRDQQQAPLLREDDRAAGREGLA